ncbi:hypothetical protein O0L34_g4009 [Tuta absoluta]|nr:hypothetical protein O0L34_g4009 [Tuta absoluta]
MRRNEEDHKKNEGSISDWISGGPVGSKGAVLVFRSCVLASRTPSMESQTKNASANTGTTILLNKAKSMARRLVAEPHSFSVRPKNIMHEVMETFGSGRNYQGQAYVVRHVSDANVPETEPIDMEEQGHEAAEHKRDIDDVLNDLNKITLKKHLNIENTTANIKPEDPTPSSTKGNLPFTSRSNSSLTFRTEVKIAAEQKMDFDNLNKITLKKHLNIENTTANIKPEDPTPSSTKEHKRYIDDVLNKITPLKKHLNIENTTANIKPEDPTPSSTKDLNDLNKITLKKHLNIENTTANIKPEDPTPSSTKGNLPFTSRSNSSLTFRTEVKIAAEQKMDFDNLNKITLKKHLNIENTTANIKPEDPTPSSTKEHKRYIDDVLNKITLKKHLNIENTTANIKPEDPTPSSTKDLNDLNKITLKKHLNIENTTANIKPEDPTPSSTKGNLPFTSRSNSSLTFRTEVKIAAEQKMDFDNLNKITLKKHLNIENTTANIKPEDPTPSSTKEHKRYIDDVLNKITLKKHLNIENTTANIKPEDPTPSSTKDLNDLNKITLKKHLNIENTTANIKPEDPTPSSTKGNPSFTCRSNSSLTFRTRVKIAAEHKMDFDDLNKITLKKHLNIENTTANIKPEDPTPSSTKDIKKQGYEAAEHKRYIDDVLNKTTLKKHLNIENTTAIIKPEDPTPSSTKNSEPQKKKKGKVKRKIKNAPPVSRTEPLDSDDSEHLLVKEVESVKVLESHAMPARTLKITYKLVNTETKLLHRLLQAHGLQEAAPESKDFNLLWSGLHPKPDVLRNLSPYQRVNHFPRSYELTRKDKLFKNIEKMQYFRGLKHFDFVPTTFLMPAEFKELCSTHFRTKGPWIVKPAASSRGRGIYIVNTPDQIPKGENVVVAKYIDKPLLIGGHKCDLRLYVCVTSIDPLLIYLYEEGLVRFATVKYDKTNKNLWNPCMHLCNYSINKYHTDYIKCDDPNAGNVGHKWTLSALLRYLRKQGRNTTSLMAAIEDLVVKSVLSSAQTITAASRVFVPNFFNCFELFGYDILIDDMLKPWLLEINLSPSLACESPLDARVKSALLADTLTLVGLPAVPMCKAEIPGQNNSLKMRIGACRRVHSAENVFVRGGKVNSPTTQHSNSGTGVLTGEELRLVRAVRAQYARRGGYVRIFPSQNSWQKYSQYLDPVTGIPVCSTSLNNNVPYTVVSHNYNLLVHSHVLPHFQHATVATNVATNDTPQRLKRYENVTITSTAPAISLGSDPTNHHDTRRAKELVKRQLQEGSRLTMGESRRAFGLFLTHVLKRVSNPGNELAVAHAVLALKFLKRASATLRMPYNGPPVKMCDKDRCAIIAKQLNDFLYMYYRETDLYTDSEDRDGCVSNIQFAQFLYSASEADLEDVLLLQLKTENNIVTFIGEPRNPYCVDLPPSKLIPEPNTKHTLLKYLANLAPVNTRRFRQSDSSREASDSLPGSEVLTYTHSDLLVKDSLKEEKPLNQALKYARS